MTAFSRRGACPALSAPMQTGDGLLVRLNPVAGGVSPNALIGLCESASRHGNGIIEVTARGSLQIRGLTTESAPLLAAEVDTLGIAVRTGVPVEIGPLAGLDPEELADPHPLAGRIREGIEAAGLATRLGPKVSVVIDGGGRLGMDPVLADVRLVAEHHDARTARHDGLWRLSVAGDSRTATPLALLPKSAAADSALAILAAIAALGRDGRAKDLELEQLLEAIPALRHQRSVHAPSVLPDIFPSRAGHSHMTSLPPHPAASRPPSPRWGEEGTGISAAPPSPLGERTRAKRAGEGTYEIAPPSSMSGQTDGGAPKPEPSRPSSTPLGELALSNNLQALAIALPFGSVLADKLIVLANTAASLGASEIRFAPRRTLLVLGLSEATCAELRAAASSLGFVTDPADPRMKIAACPGAPACASGHIATRKIAEEIVRETGDILDSSFSLHISGCAKGCAQPAEAALTLVGGEKGAGLVVSGMAKDLPAAYTPGYEAARGLGRVAELLRNQRRPGEATASCLVRLGETRVAAAFNASKQGVGAG